MEKIYRTNLIPDAEIRNMVDFELNELKLNALVLEIEQDILAIRIKKSLLLKHRLVDEQSKTAIATPTPPDTGRKIGTYLKNLGNALIGGK